MLNRIKKSNVLLILIDIAVISLCYVAAFFILDYQELYKTAIVKNIFLSVIYKDILKKEK